MIKELADLNNEEKKSIYSLPLLVSLLIAGADGEIDKKEIKQALLSMEKKTRSSSPALAEFYKEVSQDFEDKLKLLLQQYPYESTQRNPLLAEDIAKCNQIIKKLARPFAVELYQSLRLLAETIAKASGGFLGLKKVAEEERKYMSLPMLQNPANP
jgi:rubrerythrin